jgi:tRNA threonylcarbamoyladenosine biosynthesis protein TsaE
MTAAPFTKLFTNEEDTTAWAAQFALCLRAGDTLLLHGEIGAGKSVTARAIIRARLAQAEDVPSPTFTLVQTYQGKDQVEIWHADLYRLTHPDEAFELGLEDAFSQAICLIEWPDRLGDEVPQTALNIHLEAQDGGHLMMITPPLAWADRLRACI